MYLSTVLKILAEGSPSQFRRLGWVGQEADWTISLGTGWKWVHYNHGGVYAPTAEDILTDDWVEVY